VQSDDIPVHLRRLVALRDQHCQFPGGCDQPASGCEAHHVVHRADGGRTSLDNLKNYCWLCRRRHNQHYADLGIMPTLVKESLAGTMKVTLRSA
jgi:HNH endonuclease